MVIEMRRRRPTGRSAQCCAGGGPYRSLPRCLAACLAGWLAIIYTCIFNRPPRFANTRPNKKSAPYRYGCNGKLMRHRNDLSNGVDSIGLPVTQLVTLSDLGGRFGNSDAFKIPYIVGILCIFYRMSLQTSYKSYTGYTWL